jgi:hypothetical protein
VRVRESEWIAVTDERLRIVPERLWKAAHDRLDRTRAAYLRQTGGKLWGRPETGIEAKYLLSGFATCGTSGSGMHAIRRTGRRMEPKIYFTCHGWRVDGCCTNNMSISLADIDQAVLMMFREDVLSVDVIEAVITRAVELYREAPDVYAEQRARLDSEAQRLQDKISRLTEGIATGGPITSLVEALKSRELQRADTLARIEHLDGLAKAPEWSDELRQEIEAGVTEWLELLLRQPAVARQIVRKLLVGRPVLTPHQTDEGRWYDVRGEASYGRLLEGLVRVEGLVPPG